eukprot:852689_1
MCDELGDDTYMTGYVEEAGGTSLCSLDGTGCSEKQKKYIEKMKGKSLDELGDDTYMTGYVEEAGGTSLCSLDGTGCSEKQKKYIEKMKGKSLDERQKQLKRLEGMKDKDMAPALREWKNKRKTILSQLVKEEL